MVPQAHLVTGGVNAVSELLGLVARLRRLIASQQRFVQVRYAPEYL